MAGEYFPPHAIGILLALSVGKFTWWGLMLSAEIKAYGHVLSRSRRIATDGVLKPNNDCQIKDMRAAIVIRPLALVSM